MKHLADSDDVPVTCVDGTWLQLLHGALRTTTANECYQSSFHCFQLTAKARPASAMNTVKGSCLCEAVTFNIQDQPENVLQCFCTHCAKNAGASYQYVGIPHGPRNTGRL